MRWYRFHFPFVPPRAPHSNLQKPDNWWKVNERDKILYYLCYNHSLDWKMVSLSYVVPFDVTDVLNLHQPSITEHLRVGSIWTLVDNTKVLISFHISSPSVEIDDLLSLNCFLSFDIADPLNLQQPKIDTSTSDDAYTCRQHAQKRNVHTLRL